MNYPSILIGYNKIIGVIDDKIYEELKTSNFVPTSLDDISIDDFNKQLFNINKGIISQYQLRNKVIKDFGKDNVAKYINELNKINFSSTDILNVIYNLIFNLDENENFYFSKSVYDIISRNFFTQTRDLKIKIMVNSFNKYYEILNNQINIQKKVDNINSTILNLKNNSIDLTSELNEYRRGKLYKIAKKLYIVKSKLTIRKRR